MLNLEIRQFSKHSTQPTKDVPFLPAVGSSEITQVPSKVAISSRLVSDDEGKEESNPVITVIANHLSKLPEIKTTVTRRYDAAE
jgi:hypothetical protein